MKQQLKMKDANMPERRCCANVAAVVLSMGSQEFWAACDIGKMVDCKVETDHW